MYFQSLLLNVYNILYSYPNIENTIAPLHDENSLDISGVHEIDDGDSYETTEENHSGQ